MRINRRGFMTSVAAGATAAPTVTGRKSGPVGAGDRIRAAFIGVGGMGRSNLRSFMLMDEVSVAAVCDVWEHNLQMAARMTEGQEGGAAKTFSDFRRVLELRDVDVVVVSTPDHWHALPAILACQAGKDVYVEKPLALTIEEGRRMVEAARKDGRVVQVGTQQRSGKHYQEAVRLIREGRIGKVSRVACWNYENESPYGIGNPPDGDPPEGLDWDFYLGPAPRVPFNPNRFIGNFRWFWDYSGGKITDWGTHHIDIVHWAMEVKAPLSVCAVGGKYVLQDNRETPDTFEAVFEYPGFVLTYSNRVFNARSAAGRSYGIEFYGSDGTMFLDRSGFEIFPEVQRQEEEPVPSYIRQLESAGRTPRPWEARYRVPPARSGYLQGGGSEQHVSHVRNFVGCVKSREKPVSDVETAHHSTLAPHLANISLHVGRKIYWDAREGKIRGDSEANRRLKKEYRKPWQL